MVVWREDPLLLFASFTFMENHVVMGPELVDNAPAFVYKAHCPSISSLSRFNGCVAVLL